MPVDPRQIERIVRSVGDEQSFIQNLLIDGLHWRIPTEAVDMGAIAYDWTPQELQIEGLEGQLADGVIKQIVLPNNPWGVFILEFNNPDLFATGRGMTGPLRRLLRALVPKKRGSRPDQPGFKQENLLFICNHDYQHFRFAHFKAPLDTGKAAPLAAFGWGPDDPVRTVCEFNLPALAWPETTPQDDAGWVECWGAAFDVEKVTKKFYRDYADTFEAFERYVAGRPDTGGLSGDDLRLWCQTVFNRLMFLRFVERKEWLHFENQRGTNYLAALYAAGGIGGESFYRSRLRPLFFGGLAVEGEQESDAFGKVPFLNGGLFEESSLDKQIRDVPDDAFQGILGDERAGGLFYRYNFTIEESTPLDIEVAVDPEMLGKVFEELVTGRHETGSYYTPRSVVSFMCREALKGHLGDRTRATEQAIAQLVDDHVVEELTEGHAAQILKSLDDLKAMDPACGSGAYLLGLLQEIITIRRALQSQDLVADPQFLYKLKLHIISHNLYGVDIDPFATNIAMLRLWLSLAVEADEPIALPNLDFKIETGDSLLGPCDAIASDLRTAALHTMAEKLVDDKDAFLKASGIQKASLKTAIDNKLHAIAKELDHRELKGIVDWRVHFAEVFVRNGGFDIALANPPYVRQELITSIKKQLKAQFPDVYSGVADLYVYFYARGIQLLRTGGFLSYIAPNKFFRAKYGAKLRNHLVHDTHLSILIDFADYPIFQAITYPAIVITQKLKPVSQTATVKAHNWDHEDQLDSLTTVICDAARSMPQSDLDADAWRIIDSDVARVINKMRESACPLGELTGNTLYYGIKTGRNEAFEIDEDTRHSLVNADPKSEEAIRPWLRGRNVGRWIVKWDEKYLIFTRRGIRIKEYPAIKEYLTRYREALEPRPADIPAKGWKGRKPGNYKWYEVQDAIDYWQEFNKPKIIYQVIATYQQFAYTDQPFLSNDKTWIIPDPPPGLLAYLNSKVAWFFLDQVAPKLQGGAFELRSPAMTQVPVPTLSKKLATLEKRALRLAQGGSDDAASLQATEVEIDEEVIGLCGLSAKDASVVEEVVEAAGNRFPQRFRESAAYQDYVAEMFGDD